MRARGRMLAWRISESVKVDELPNDTARLLYTWIISHCDNLGRFHGEPAQVLAIVFPKRQDIGHRKVESYLTAMAKLGLIQWYRVDGLRYLAIPDKVWRENQRLDRMQKSDFPPPAEPLVTTGSELVTSGVPEVEVEVEGEVERERTLAARSAPAVGLPAWLPLDSWNSWVEYRRRMGQRVPWTDGSAKASIRTLERLRAQGHEPGAVIEQAILRGWRGLFPLESQANPHNPAAMDKTARLNGILDRIRETKT